MERLDDESRFRGARSVVTLGMFDGVHAGHAALIRRAVFQARECGAPCVVFTFREHPLTVLRPDCAPPALASREERARLIAELGADVLIERPFARDFADLSPDAFALRLSRALRPALVVVGYNYSFGKGGAGDPASLARAGRALGFSVEALPPFSLLGAPVSSTRVRALLAEGEVALAARLLGREYALPLADGLLPEDRARPCDGAYEGRFSPGGAPVRFAQRGRALLNAPREAKEVIYTRKFPSSTS